MDETWAAEMKRKFIQRATRRARLAVRLGIGVAAFHIAVSAAVVADDGAAKPHRRIIVGGYHRYPPYEFLDEQGRPTGYNVDLTRAIAEALDLEVEIRLGPWKDIRRGLTSGDVDAIHGMFYSVERARACAFTQPHAVIQHVAVVRRGHGPPPRTVADLCGKRIVVMRGDIMHDFAIGHALRENLHTVSTQAEALRQVVEGEQDCALVARLPALYWAEQNSWDQLLVGTHPLLSSEYCYAVSLDDMWLRGQLSEGLKILEKTGTYDTIQQRWLGVADQKPPRASHLLKYAGLIVVGLVAILLGVLFWTWLLRKEVARRTAALQESEARWRSLADAMPTLVWTASPDGLVQYVSRQWVDFTGHPEQDLLGARWAELVHPDDAAEAKRSWQETLACGSADTTELRFRRSDGTYRWFIVRAVPIRDEQGNIVQWYGSNNDVEDLKQAQADLKKKEQYYRDMIASLHEDILIIDREGRITDVNDAALATLGRTRNDVIGRPCCEVSRGRPISCDDPAEQSGRAEVLATGTSCVVHHEHITPDGTRIHRDVLMSPIKDSEGHVTHIIEASRDITELFEAQRALAESQATLQAAMDQCQAGIAIAEAPSGKLRYVNRAGLAIHGGTLEEATGDVEIESYAASWHTTRPDGTPFPPDELPLARAILHGETVSDEFIIHRDDQEDRVVWASAAPVKNEQGDIISGVVAFLDVTEQRRAEQAARESQRRYREIFDASRDGFVVVDKDGRITDANHAFCDMLGYSLEELLSMEDFYQITPEHWQEWEREEIWENRLLTQGYSGIYEKEYRRKDGTVFPVELQAYAAFGEDGSMLYLWGIARDITERKQAAEALEKRIIALTEPLTNAAAIAFEDLFNLDDIQRLQDEFATATGVASIITKPDGTPITKPSSFCRLCKDIIRATEKGRRNCYRSDAALGQCNPDGPTIQPCMSGGLWDAGAGIKVGGVHIANWLIGQVRDDTQSEEAMRAYARTIGADEDAVAEAFHEVPAMSRERFGQVARALSTLANQLSTTAYQNVQQARFITERHVVERERERLEHQLRQSQKLEAVGQLAGGVAHDFNNILTAILGNVHLSMDSVRTALGTEHRAVQSMEQIEQAAQRAASLTRQLLTFSRRDVMQPKILNLNTLINELDPMLRRLITENITLTIHTDDDLQSIQADAGHIEQMIVNLVVNAVHAMPDGGTVTIETHNTLLTDQYASAHTDARPGPHVQLVVRDTGCGMDAETREHMFDPFYTTKPVDKGTGLGLATVHGIVKQCSGHIVVDSALGAGATFYIYLPATSVSPSKKPALQEEEPLLSAKSKSVLLCEDDALVCDLIAKSLRSAGYDVVTAENGETGIQVAKTHTGSIDLLITDVIMPDMNGRAMAERVQTIRPGLPTLFISGYTADVIAQHGVLDEHVDFLEKPFTRAGLLAKVRDLLKKSQQTS